MKRQINSTEKHNFEKALVWVAKEIVISTTAEHFNGHLGDRKVAVVNRWPMFREV